MSAMASLRPAVDAFFDKVTVNVDDSCVAREPAEPAQRDSRSHPRGGGFFEDRGVVASAYEAICCFRSCPRKRASSFAKHWAPAFAGTNGVTHAARMVRSQIRATSYEYRGDHGWPSITTSLRFT